MRVRLLLKVICAAIAIIAGVFWLVYSPQSGATQTTIYIIEKDFFQEHSSQIKDTITTHISSGQSYGIILAATGMDYILPPTQDIQSITTYLNAISLQSFAGLGETVFSLAEQDRVVLFGSRHQRLADSVIDDSKSLQTYHGQTLTEDYQPNKNSYSYGYVIIYALVVIVFLLV